MALSNDLISQFVKVTNDRTKRETETTHYGTIVEYNGSRYIRIDGSDLLTRIDSTVSIKDGDRATVTIRNHHATVNGNLSDPAASSGTVNQIGGKVTNLEAENLIVKDTLIANKAEIDKLTAEDVIINGTLTANAAEIESLKTTKLDASVAVITYATIGELEATNADIYNLRATYGDFEVLTTNQFNAINGVIDNLDANYANIDFANIGEAAVEKLFASSGIIKDLVMSGGYVTGELVGVTIKGDLIEANTIVANSLILQGTDGLYYRLNTNGEKVEASQTAYNSINGSIITAQSITANKVNVDDLVAFDATIGGFNITDSAIYSGVKSSVDNTTRGVYLDSTGQVAFGDSTSYIKYYKDMSDDSYKLDISARSIKLRSSDISEDVATSGMVDSAHDATNTRISHNETLIQQLSDCISFLVTDNNGESLMTQTANGWTFNMQSVNDTVNNLSSTISSLQSTTGSTQATVNALKNAINDLETTAEYVRITTYQSEPCIELGKSGSDFKLMITNTRIMFMKGSSVPTYIDTTGLVTENITINGELHHGKYVWKQRSNGNYGVQYVG